MDSRTKSSKATDDEEGTINFRGLPPTFILPAHLTKNDIQNLEKKLLLAGAPVTIDQLKSRLFLTQAGTNKRALFELRKVGIWTQEESYENRPPLAKRQKNSSDKTTRLEIENDYILVLRLQWIEDCIGLEELVPVEPYILLYGRKISREAFLQANDKIFNQPSDYMTLKDPNPSAILTRARSDVLYSSELTSTIPHLKSAPHGARSFRSQAAGTRYGNGPKEKPLLVLAPPSSPDAHADRSSTPSLCAGAAPSSSAEEEASGLPLPAAPAWLLAGAKYSCQRRTVRDCANSSFVEVLQRIRLARTLTGDEVGVRAYSTAIAAIAALDSVIQQAGEVLRLPGCDVRMANCWVEWKNGGEKLDAAQEVQTSEHLRTLDLFYNIWGVGDKTARYFYDKGWRDLDDVVQWGWDELTRVQKIGVKYYDEFKIPIPKQEMEFILGKVKEHAIKVRDEGIEALLVGGYRKRKEQCSDVDIILSHRKLHQTQDLIEDLIVSLAEEGWITHNLRVDMKASNRKQEPIPIRAKVDRAVGGGFDNLDKSLVVWQDINWSPAQEGDKNPNPHRRVDIIISPWRTVGCAVLGWSAGTTFERDLRKYAKAEKRWKFDSSGVRSRLTGQVVNLEGINGVSGDMEDAEKAVFRGLGLDYREPWERETG